MIKRHFLLFIFLISLLLLFILFIKLNTHLQELDVNNKQSFIQLVETEKRRRSTIYLPILLYHYVEIVTDERDTIRKSLSITPYTFETQIKDLLKAGYTPIKFSQLVDYYEHNKELPQKPIIFTFDDGYRDFYTDIFPILKKYHFPATMYMVANFVDYTKNYLTTAQLQELAKSDLIEIGSHGVTHYGLATMSEKEAEIELAQSKKTLETIIGKPVIHLAYPYGSYNLDVVRLTRKVGYKTAVTVDPGTIQSYFDLLMLKRLRPGGLTGEALLEFIKAK